MDIITFDDNAKPKENINYKYIESCIREYIDKNNFPKKLVINEIKADISKIDKLHARIKQDLETLNTTVDKFKAETETIKKENHKKLTNLLNQFSSAIF